MTNTNNTTTYYLIRNRTLGKRENGIYYLFKDGNWVPDIKNSILDRLMGYDPNEPDGSPYKTGNMDIMDTIETITEEQALRFINEQSTTQNS